MPQAINVSSFVCKEESKEVTSVDTLRWKKQLIDGKNN